MLNLQRFVRALVGLLAILFLISCTHVIVRPPTVSCNIPEKRITIDRTVFVDSNIGQLETDRIHQAMFEWTQRTNGLVRWQIGVIPTAADLGNGPAGVCSKSIVITGATSDSEIVKKIEQLQGSKIVAVTYSDCQFNFMILVIDRLPTVEGFQATALHELGHYLGLHHVDDKTSLMYPDDSGGATCVTKKDMEQFCKVWKCDVKAMDPCH